RCCLMTACGGRGAARPRLKRCIAWRLHPEMSVYHYRAYNAAGETVSGALDTSSLATLEARLRTAGLWLLDAREGGAPAVDAKVKVSRLKLKRRDQIA